MWQAFVEQAENSYSINWQKIKHQDSMLSCLLQNAVAEKNIKVAEILLQNGADVDTKNDRGQTLLYGEVNETNNLEIVNLLVRYGADVNAIDNYKIPVISRAVFSRNINIIKFLIDNGADIESAESPDKGSQYRPIDLLYYPIIEGKLDIVKLLLENGAKSSLEDRPGEVLSTTVARGNLHMAQFLIEYGIDVNARRRGGKTALFFSETQKMTQFLIDNGAEVNARDFSRPNPFKNPLAKAIDLRNIEAIKLLITNGADVDTTTRRADNPLMLAILEQDREIVQLLLDLGADPWYLEPENIKGYLLSKPTFFRTDIPIFLRNNQFRIKKN